MAQNLGHLFIDGEDVIEDLTSNHTLGLYGNLTTNTTYHKYGEKGMYFYGTNGTYIDVPASTDFQLGPAGTGNDWTIDFWALKMSGETYVYFQWVLYSNNVKIGLNNTNVVLYGDGTNVLVIDYNAVNDTAADTWSHYAFTKSGTIITLYINGIAKATGIDTNFSMNSKLIIGKRFLTTALSHLFYGSIENYRITKGTALWTEDFDLTDEALLYKDSNSYVRSDNISGLYSLGSRGNLRGKASEGFIRPTIKQFFTSEDFEEVASENDELENSEIEQFVLLGAGCHILDIDLLKFDTLSTPGAVVFNKAIPASSGKYYFEWQPEAAGTDNSYLNWMFAGLGLSNVLTGDSISYRSIASSLYQVCSLMIDTDINVLTPYRAGVAQANINLPAQDLYTALGKSAGLGYDVYRLYFREEDFTYYETIDPSHTAKSMATFFAN